MAELTARGQAFRAAIAGFIQARRDARQKTDDDAAAAAKYDYATWLADAARRVTQIQAVTHVLKATHPDARGTSLHVIPADLPQRPEIGTHLLGDDYAEDIVGNAAALDVFKLLKLEVEGRRLLDWMRADDADLQTALSDDPEKARDWMRAFASLVREDAAPISHPLAKQLYWLAGDDPHDDAAFHLLQPMFASALAQAVHADIQDARFGEANKQARQAHRNGQPCDTDHRDYRGLAVRKLGGTKPQNISQLNSERGGVNYLLASLPPPAWSPRAAADLLHAGSVFDERRGGFFWFGEIRTRIRELTAFLATDPEPNQATREQVARLTGVLGEELANFGAAVRGRYPPGWSRDDACQLPLPEKLWLDPSRSELPLRNDPKRPYLAEDDAAFNAAYALGDWADAIAGAFGRWLNGQLRRRDERLAALGDAEIRHFARETILDVAWPIPLQRRAGAGAA